MKTKYLWGIVAILLIGWFFLRQDGSDSVVTTSPTPKAGASATPKVSGTPAPGTGAVPSTSTPPSNLSYGEAIKVYAGTRIQFNAQCQASPNSITVKNGQSVMFDNRSGDARWFSLNGTGYYVAGYGFRIIPFSSKTLPQTFTIDCGSAQNVGNIVVQK